MNLKNSGDSTGFEPMTSAMRLQCSNQLSYEVTQLRAGQFVGLMFSRERNVDVAYQFTCAGCNACYVGETFRHTFVSMGRDRTSHIFHHLQNSDECLRLSSESCFSILDTAPNRFHLKLKEAAHICWTNPSLTRQLKHEELTLSF